MTKEETVRAEKKHLKICSFIGVLIKPSTEDTTLYTLFHMTEKPERLTQVTL